MVFSALSRVTEIQHPVRIGKIVLISVCLFSLTLVLQTPAHSFIEPPREGVCGAGPESSKECTPDVINTAEKAAVPRSAEKKTSKGLKKQPDTVAEKKTGERTITSLAENREVIVYFFRGKGCPHCEQEKLFLDEMKGKYPGIRITEREVWYNKQNAGFLAGMAKSYNVKASGVPFIFIGENAFIGFSNYTKAQIEESIRRCLSAPCIDPALVARGRISLEKKNPSTGIGETAKNTGDLACPDKGRTVFIPWIGNIDASEMSIPVMTIIIAALDSFNPCAFFVLFSLLGLLVHAQSRKKMFLIGSEFVFFSGFIYFLFMAAWLNVFLLMGQVEIITKIAGAIAIIIAAINIKDFFIFKKGISLTIPDSAKPKLFDRMRRLLKSSSVFSIIIGTAILAVAANSYELLCTAGFPMVYTRILTLKNLSGFSYYMYLVFYNLVYVIPLAVIVIIFTVTLGRKFLSEEQARLLKLLSGTMMLGLGGVLLFEPAVLNNAVISLLLLVAALIISLATAFLMKRLKHPK
jgi:thiol-disulfide isomerase/thioredoxin